jgi:hypothetical protein
MFDPDNSPPAAGESAVQLRVSRPLPPLNDTCQGAEVIPSAGPFPLLTGVSDLRLATTDGDPPLPSCQPAVTSSVWYKFTPSASATYRLTTCAGTATTLRDSVMALYTSKGNCAGPFAELACNDDDCELRSTITFPLSAGTTYCIVVWAYDTGAALMDANVQLRVSVVFPPVVNTGAATAITSTGAALHGSVQSYGSDTWAWFEWGTTTDYGNATPAQDLGSGASTLAVSDTLSDLEPSTFMHYRLVATNQDGVTFGADRTFSTTGAVEQRFTLQECLTNGSFRIQFNGALGQTYSVQTSSNLVDWANAGAAAHLGGGLFEFVDTSATNAPVRFYRTSSP